jgi:hypothetical protein
MIRRLLRIDDSPFTRCKKLSPQNGGDLFCPQVELFLGDRLDPAFALWKIARPAPKVQEYPYEPGVFLEGNFGSTPLTTLPLTQHHLAVDDFDRGAADQTMALGAKNFVLIFPVVIPYTQGRPLYDTRHVAGESQVYDAGANLQDNVLLFNPVAYRLKDFRIRRVMKTQKNKIFPFPLRGGSLPCALRRHARNRQLPYL